MKIADFGLARDVHNIDYYKKTTNVSECLSHSNASMLVMNVRTDTDHMCCVFMESMFAM